MELRLILCQKRACFISDMGYQTSMVKTSKPQRSFYSTCRYLSTYLTSKFNAPASIVNVDSSDSCVWGQTLLSGINGVLLIQQHHWWLYPIDNVDVDSCTTLSQRVNQRRQTLLALATVGTKTTYVGRSLPDTVKITQGWFTFFYVFHSFQRQVANTRLSPSFDLWNHECNLMSVFDLCYIHVDSLQ